MKKTEADVRKPRLYLPRALTETILALTRGRTIIYFGARHRCLELQALVDDEHLKHCNHLEGLGQVRSLIEFLRGKNIHE